MTIGTVASILANTVPAVVATRLWVSVLAFYVRAVYFTNFTDVQVSTLVFKLTKPIPKMCA